MPLSRVVPFHIQQNIFCFVYVYWNQIRKHLKNRTHNSICTTLFIIFAHFCFILSLFASRHFHKYFNTHVILLQCECGTGYMRDPRDRTRCKATEGHASLLFARRHDIRKISLDRREMTSIVNDTKSATALDFVFRTGMIFWSDVSEQKIFKWVCPCHSSHTFMSSWHDIFVNLEPQLTRVLKKLSSAQIKWSPLMD